MDSRPSHTHAQAIDKRPKIGDEILLTFGELQDLIKDTCRFHAVGVAEHVESTGHTYQSVNRVECAMTDFGVVDMFSSRCFGRRDEMDELWSGPLSWKPIFATFYSHLSPSIISDVAPSESCLYCTANSEGVRYPSAEWILRWL